MTAAEFRVQLRKSQARVASLEGERDEARAELAELRAHRIKEACDALQASTRVMGTPQAWAELRAELEKVKAERDGLQDECLTINDLHTRAQDELTAARAALQTSEAHSETLAKSIVTTAANAGEELAKLRAEHIVVKLELAAAESRAQGAEAKCEVLQSEMMKHEGGVTHAMIKANAEMSMQVDAANERAQGARREALEPLRAIIPHQHCESCAAFSRALLTKEDES